MSRFKAVIFDLDGTILYTLPDICDALNYALSAYGRPTHTLEAVRSFVSGGARRLLERALPKGAEDEDIDAIIAEFARRYSLHAQDSTVPYDGITELLDAIRERGVTVAVVTNKAHKEAEEMVKNYFGDRAALTVGKKDYLRSKPAPDSLNEALSVLGIDAASALYVGDSEIDLATAENAGMPCVLVSWGYRGREILEKLPALGLIDRPEELLDYIGE